MSTNDVLTLAIATVGAAVALATLVFGCLEYVRRGKQARIEMFFELRARLREPELLQLAELIDEANSPDPVVSGKAKPRLAEFPFRIKRQYLGLFEEVDLVLDWGLIEPEVAHYMFGYYALHCANCETFWLGVGEGNDYWERFRKFCERMEGERLRFERRLSVGVEPVPGQEPSPASVCVRLPPVLRPKAEGAESVQLEGGTVGQVLIALTELHPGLRSQIFAGDSTGNSDGLELQSYINVYCGDQDVRVLEGLTTPVEPGGTVVLLPAAAGG